MQLLNLPEYQFRYKVIEDKKYIFDEFRKKYIALTPEEWVRQNFLKFLVHEKHYPESMISVEKEIKLNSLSKRCDAIIFSHQGPPLMILECKSPNINISQQTFDQIYRYNLVLNVKYLLVTNGMKHYLCKIDFEKKQYFFMKDIFDYNEL